MSTSNNGIWEGKGNVNLLIIVRKLKNPHFKVEKIRSKTFHFKTLNSVKVRNFFKDMSVPVIL